VKRLGLRVPREIYAGVSLLAEVRGVSVNQLVIEVLAAEVAASKNDPETRAKVERHLSQIKGQYGL
jgi:DNA-binding GntR family transcriptional regulator